MGSGESGRDVGLFSTIGASTTSRTGASLITCKKNILFWDRNEKRPRGIIPLEGVNVQQIFKLTKDCVFEIFNAIGSSDTIKSAKTDSRGAVVQGNHKRFR